MRKTATVHHSLTRRQLIATAILTAASAATPIQRVVAQTLESTPASVSEAPRFSLRPLDKTAKGYPELEIQPGATAELRVGVSVSGTVPAELTLFPADTIPAMNGGFAAAGLGADPTGHTLWMDIKPTGLGGTPGDTIEFIIPVTVPADASPGQYITALVVQTNPLEIPGTTTFDQVLRSALPVVINVPGPISPGMDVGAPVITTQAGTHVLQITVTNTGNILIKPDGTVSLTNPDGEIVLKVPIAMKAIYLGLKADIRVAIPKQMPMGEYRVTYEITEPTHGLRASLADFPITLDVPEAAGTSEPVTLIIDPATVIPSGDPIRFADVSMTIVNNGPYIPTARVSLIALRDGNEIETYTLANNQVLPSGPSTVGQRYIPESGWQAGTWTFQVVVTGVDVASGAEAILTAMELADEIVVEQAGSSVAPG